VGQFVRVSPAVSKQKAARGKQKLTAAVSGSKQKAARGKQKLTAAQSNACASLLRFRGLEKQQEKNKS
jgi:hypothetical protein